MATIQERINQDWKEAMKSRDPKKDALNLMRNELKNKAIATRESGDSSTELNDDSAIEVLTKMSKQRRDSIEQYQNAGRDDLVQKEQAELDAIESYLPKKLSSEELEALVKETISELSASGLKDMGKVMGAMMGKAKGRADGGQIQAFVKKHLGE